MIDFIYSYLKKLSKYSNIDDTGDDAREAVLIIPVQYDSLFKIAIHYLNDNDCNIYI